MYSIKFILTLQLLQNPVISELLTFDINAANFITATNTSTIAVLTTSFTSSDIYRIVLPSPVLGSQGKINPPV